MLNRKSHPGEAKRKAIRQPTPSERDMLTLIIEEKFPGAVDWILELQRWPESNLETCIAGIICDHSDLEDDETSLAVRDECSHKLALTKQAAEFTFDLQSKKSIGAEFHQCAKTVHDREELEAEAGRFFNHQECDADFAVWFGKPGWTEQEAAAICLGKDPEQVNDTTLSNIPDQSKFKSKYSKLVDQVKRTKEMGMLGTKSLIDPAHLATWSKKQKIEVADSFSEASRQLAGVKPQAEETRKINSLYRMILTLAYMHYDFKPWNVDPPPTRQIFEAMEAFREGADQKAVVASQAGGEQKAIEASNRGAEMKERAARIKSFKLEKKTWDRHFNEAADWARGIGLFKEKFPPETT